MNICKTCLSRFGCNPSFETDGVDICSMYKADERALPTQIDWEQRRYEIAKDILSNLSTIPNATFKNVENTAITLADRLIERLKEK